MSLTVQPTMPDAAMPDAARAELRAAYARLQQGPGLASRLADILGSALGGAGRMALGMLGGWGAGTLLALPGLSASLQGVAETALARAFDIAVLGLPAPAGAAPPRTSGRRAGFGVAMSGAAGGAAGLLGFAPDAAVTTLAIMRRIARIAQEEGEDLTTETSRRACLEVFALRTGLPGPDGASNEAGYFPTRLLLQGGSLVRLMSEVAARYGVQLGQKLAAQAVPVAGAVCGAAINAAFMAQYDALARAHFTVRRLERQWGKDAVAAALRQQ